MLLSVPVLSMPGYSLRYHTGIKAWEGICFEGLTKICLCKKSYKLFTNLKKKIVNRMIISTASG